MTQLNIIHNEYRINHLDMLLSGINVWLFAYTMLTSEAKVFPRMTGLVAAVYSPFFGNQSLNLSPDQIDAQVF